MINITQKPKIQAESVLKGAKHIYGMQYTKQIETEHK